MNSAFVKKLLAVAPQFKAAYTEHLKGNDELVPHVFMADVTREVVSTYEDHSRLTCLKALLVFFESELKSGDAEAKDLIGASFCENLLGDDRATTVLLPLMGTSLRGLMLGMKR